MALIVILPSLKSLSICLSVLKFFESIYEVVAESSYKKPTGAYANRAGHSRKNRV